MPRLKKCYRKDTSKNKDKETMILVHDETQEEQKSVCMGLYAESEQNKRDVGYVLGADVEKQPFFFIPFFPRSMFATVLEDVITAIRILGECNNFLRIMKVNFDMPMLLAHKYGVADKEVVSELDDIDPRRLGCKEYKMAKLDRDRKVVLELLQMTYQAIVVRCSFRTMWNYCQEATEREQFALILKNDTTLNKSNSRSLKKHLRQQRVMQRASLYDADAVIDSLEKQRQDQEQIASIQERYVVRWQSSLTEQHVATIKENDEVYSKSSEKNKKRMEQESVVHNEVETLVSVVIQETLQEIEIMMNKYDTDMEKIDLRIQIMRADLGDATDRRKYLEDKIAAREIEMKNWIKFKEEREERLRFERRMLSSAITVQAWWRGLLVRHKLGPYRPRRERRKDKKGAKSL